ncbi:hypothetical protein H1C71_011483 [Ictidomys tridecemlineatus]|nr:hypothetical protein H1C71_011483 [Ictidomys tridecemlineatus]
MKVGEDVAYGHHLCTQPSCQDHGVAERAADGNVPVIGHHSQEEVFHGCKANEEIGLGQAAHVGNGLCRGKYILQHLGDRGGGEADVCQGQVTEEEVHGGVKVRSGDNKYDECKIARNVDCVHE